MNNRKRYIDPNLYNVKGPLFFLLNSLDGIYFLDREYRFTFVNDVVINRSGHNREWFLGKSYLERIRPEYKQRVKKNLDATLNGQSVPPYELAYYAADGSEKWSEINTTQISDDNHFVTGILVISRDITLRRKNEAELEQHRNHLERLVKEKTKELTEINKQLNYKIKLENIAKSIAASFMSLPVEQIYTQIDNALKKIGRFLHAGRSYMFLFNDEDKTMDKTHEWCAAGIKPYIEKQRGMSTDRYSYFINKIKNLEVMCLSDTDSLPSDAINEKRICETQRIKSMILVPMIYRGRATGFIGLDYPQTMDGFDKNTAYILENVSMSITNAIIRSETLVALEKSEAKYKAMFATAHDPIFLLKDYKFMECNDYTLKLFCCRREDIIGKYPADFSPPTQPDGSQSKKKSIEYMSRAASGEPQFFEWQHCTFEGDIIETEVSLGSLGIKDDHMIIAIIRDITRRKKAERELQVNAVTLQDYNAALKILLKQREDDKNELEISILDNTKNLVLPYIQKLRQGHLNHEQKIYIDILEANLKNIISPFSRKLAASSMHFTPAEIKIANLIKEGRTVKEIALVLGVSTNSVNLHRQNIRNKLDLNKKKISLRTYLMSIAI